MSTKISTETGILIGEIMTSPPLALAPDASLAEAARMLADSEAADLMVVDSAGKLVGVLDEGDLIRAVLPDVDEIRAAGGSVEDGLAAFVRKGGELAGRPLGPYVVHEPLTVSPDDHAGVAAVMMIERRIRRLPVVDEGQLVGTVSRGEVCRAVLSSAGAL
ncbi:MAG TPA: CBS domain-containing protein [Gaiellaceae bacterium]